MIKKLKRKFVFTTTFSLFIVLMVFISTINIVNILDVKNSSDSLLKIMSLNGGVIPREFNPKKGDYKYDRYSKETPFETRYFSIKVFYDGGVSINIQNIASTDFNEARALGAEVLNSGKEKGYKGYYRFLTSDKFDHKLIIFLDTRNEIRRSIDFFFITLIVGILFIVIFMFIFNYLSDYAIKPYLDNIEKQKRFITNAGHEIKTPLAIISANTEVLEMFNGENEWTKSILNQVKRMNNLVSGLLALSKMEEHNNVLVNKDFKIGTLLNSLINEFSPIFEGRGLKVSSSIDEEVLFRGNEEYIYNLFSILLDNAGKYAKENGNIDACLKIRDSKIEIIISNTYEGFKDKNLDYLFDRFYREDNSRSMGGYGLGLSIAKSIVDLYKGSINAYSKDNMIYFKIRLNLLKS